MREYTPAGEKSFAISLPTLFEKSGVEGTYRRFKFELQKLTLRNDLPGIVLAWEEGDGKEPRIPMWVRDADESALEEDPPARRDVRPATARNRHVMPTPAPLLLQTEVSEEMIAHIRGDFPGWDIYARKAEFDR